MCNVPNAFVCIEVKVIIRILSFTRFFKHCYYFEHNCTYIMYVHTCLGFERFLNAFMFTIMHPELLENRWKCVTIQVGWDVKRITIQLVVGGSSYECISEGNWHQRLSYYREMRGSVSFTIGESITANLDHVCLNNQSHYSLDVIEFQSELYDTRRLRIP